MSKSSSQNRLILRIKIFFHEFTYILKAWILYLQFKYIHRKEEPKGYFYEQFKGNKDYTQICYNTEYKIHSEHYKFYHKDLFKYVKKPYQYFQMFSNKEFNCKFNNSERFFPKEPPIRIVKIAPHTYYEGIEFNNILFDSFQFEQICFHNCSFRNCCFKNIIFKKDIVGFAPNFIQGFSTCDFFNVTFEKCAVTAFSYYDKTNLTLEEWSKYKIWMSVKHKDVADTLFAIEQIWTTNHIREEHNNYANFYYQRKKAETRSLTKWSRFTGFISEFIIGYGEKPFRALLSMGILIFIFSFVYLFTGFSPSSNSSEIKYCITGHIDSFNTLFTDYLQSFYYSFFTMISVGQGSASPLTAFSQIAMSLELLLGAILMTLFTGTLFRKYTK